MLYRIQKYICIYRLSIVVYSVFSIWYAVHIYIWYMVYKHEHPTSHGFWNLSFCLGPQQHVGHLGLRGLGATYDVASSQALGHIDTLVYMCIYVGVSIYIYISMYTCVCTHICMFIISFFLSCFRSFFLSSYFTCSLSLSPHTCVRL